MSDKPHILLVDDDRYIFPIERKLLGEDNFRFSTACDGADCLVKIEVDQPQVILLDINMPGLSGIEICQRIRRLEHGNEISIIFVSGEESAEARLAAYDAGGDDFITKPLSSDEIRHKVELTLKHRREVADLRRNLSDTMNMAMSALSASGELGVILHFFNRTFACQTVEALVRAILDALSSYGLVATVQVRNEQDITTLNSEGRCSLIEQELLLNLAKDPRRIFGYGNRTVVSFPHVVLLIKNMPTEDQERYGRAKDNVALLAEGAEYRLLALIGELRIRRRQQRLATAIRAADQTLGEIDAHYKRNQSGITAILGDLDRQLEASFGQLALSEEQEQTLLAIVQPLAKRASQLYDEGLKIDDKLATVLNSLNEAVKD